ncbi:CRTAC1 family protein, partial [candidate division TA06 bacterium]|nr:CRTAC1 family protein [candidate division TA06 bacterium]
LQNHKSCIRGNTEVPVYCHPDAYNGVSDLLYHNNGDGTFTDVTQEAGLFNPEGKGLGVVCTDYDNDGDVDLYIANDSVRNFLYRNNGDGTFADVTFRANVGYNEDGKTEASMGTDFGDYDNDGYFDVFVTNLDAETNTLYHNEGDGTFADVTYASGLGEVSWLYVGWGTSFFDYDNDGDQDLFVANGNTNDNVHLFSDVITYSQRNHLFRNRGDGTFENLSSQSGVHFSEARVSRGAAFGDFDNDGDLDILLTNSNDFPNLLRNDGGNQDNWLLVKTVGTRSNRDGIGTRITVVSGDLTQVEEVRSGSSYLSQNDLRLHFGLGKRKKIDLLEIRWPSGLVETHKNIEVNQILVATEGEGIEAWISP